MSTHAAVQKRQHEESVPQNVGPEKSPQAAGAGLPLFMQANPMASAGVTLQRKCACGGTPGANDECETCNSGKLLQAKLAIGASDDPLEQEADRVADQVLAMPANPTVGVAPPRIQRYTGQVTAQTGTAPASVDHVLASSGRPLAATLQQDMGQRFGHDFSRVRVHSGSEAEQSARDVSAHAYTVGNNVVFGEGRFAPETYTGRRLLAHELTHVVQQSNSDEIVDSRSDKKRGLPPISAPIQQSTGGHSRTVTPHTDALELAAKRVTSADAHKISQPSVLRKVSPTVVARKSGLVREASEQDRRDIVDAAARWLVALADQVESLRGIAAVALATTEGRAAAPRAFYRYMNEEVLGRLLTNAISVFETQRRDNPHVNFPAESPEQTRLGEAYARAIEQLGLAIEEAHGNAANLAPSVRETEERAYALNHLRWLEANPSAPLAAGVRTTFTQTEMDISARRYQLVAAELTNLRATVHLYNLAGDGAPRLRGVLLNAVYRLARDPTSGGLNAQPDTALMASIQPVLDTLNGIEWAIARAIDRLARAEARTRGFVASATANQAVGDTLQVHFATRDPGYAALLADRLARMTRELRGEGALTVHARDPHDTHCGAGSVGGGLSIVLAHAEANRFRFCTDVSVGDEEGVSTVVHETVHAVIPGLGAGSPVSSSSSTPDDRAYASERIYSRLATEEALANAESYSFYVDSLLGVQVARPSAPQDSVAGCTDPGPVRDAIARATYRIRLAAMWAEQTFAGESRTTPQQHVIDVIRAGFPGADAARAHAIRVHLRNLAGSLDYFLFVACRAAGDREARAQALVYGPSSAATMGGVIATQATYPAATLRICPAWFQVSEAVREDALTSILVLRYRQSVPVSDVEGIVALTRFLQEQAHPAVTGRTLQQHQAADAPPP